MEIVRLEERQKWDKIVTLFNNYDVYYLNGYVRAFALHGDGIPVLCYYNTDEGRAICVLMVRDIAKDINFTGKIPNSKYWDAVTPYGYGGFLTEGNIDYELLNEEFLNTLKELGIISVFYRFHPVLANADSLSGGVSLVPMGKTIAIDLSSPEIIWNNIISKNRNMIRKAEKHGVEIFHGKNRELLKIFRNIYNATMDHDQAVPYYYFTQNFYDSINDDLHDNYEIFYAVYNNEIISMAIMIFANGYLNYHLSGSKFEYRHLAPTNLLLYKAALWGYENGLRIFHLGGGIGSGEDNLYKFKSAFNRISDYRFVVGKSIVNEEAYKTLLTLRAFTQEQEENISFFPKYRATI